MNLRTMILLLLLGSLTASAGAAEKESWFQVEVVVFEYTRPDTDGESWYGNPGLPEQTDSIDLVQGEAPAWLQTGEPEASTDNGAQAAEEAGIDRVPYLQLPEKAYNLDGVYRVLKLAGAYRPLYHASWQQPGIEEADARYVHFSAYRDSREDTGDGDAAAAAEAAYQPPPVTAFDALVRLRTSHFLHLDIDAAYFPEDPAVLHAGSADLPAYQYADYVRLQESRRVRLKELHYFDNPLFGVIVQVTRIEDNKKSEE